MIVFAPLDFQGLVGVQEDMCVKRGLFLNLTYGLANGSTDKQKNGSYDDHVTLVHRSNGPDTVVMLRNCNVQVGKLSASKAYLDRLDAQTEYSSYVYTIAHCCLVRISDIFCAAR